MSLHGMYHRHCHIKSPIYYEFWRVCLCMLILVDSLAQPKKIVIVREHAAYSCEAHIQKMIETAHGAQYNSITAS